MRPAASSRDAGADGRGDGGERLLGDVVQVAEGRWRLPVDRDRPEDLAGVAADARAELDEHGITGGEAPLRPVLGRDVATAAGHRRGRDETDPVATAEPPVGRLDERAKL